MVAKHPRASGWPAISCSRSTAAGASPRRSRRTTRRAERLADELGVEPGEELRALQDAILQHDPALCDGAGGGAPARARRRGLAAARRPRAGARLAARALGGGPRRQRSRWSSLAGAPGHGQDAPGGRAGRRGPRRAAARVLYASGAGPPGRSTTCSTAAAARGRPLLLVVDDADQASARRAGRGPRRRPAARRWSLATATRPRGARARSNPASCCSSTSSASGPAAVAQIAALYVPDRGRRRSLPPSGCSARAPASRSASTTSRACGRGERVGTVADGAAAGRSRLRSMEDELAGGVVQLQTVREWREPPADGDARVICPFKGLASFEAADAPYFFGRERLVAELVARLVGAPAAGRRRPVGQRQVVRRARRPPPRPARAVSSPAASTGRSA